MSALMPWWFLSTVSRFPCALCLWAAAAAIGDAETTETKRPTECVWHSSFFHMLTVHFNWFTHSALCVSAVVQSVFVVCV